jgi:hypothetical protein
MTTDQTPESPEKTVRDHVTTLHLIGEQLAQVESWMWQHLADVRAVSSVGQAPATSQTALRDAVAEALHARLPGCTHDEHGHDCRALTDAVMPALPAPVDRAAEWRAAADHLDALHLSGVEGGIRSALTAELRRAADEAAAGRVADNTQPETLRAERLRAADLLEKRNPDRSEDFSEGVDWAIAELRCMTDPDRPAVGGAQQQEEQA